MNPLGFLRDILAQLSTAPAWALLLTKATLLLMVAWVVHFGLARANPRWRSLLWRGTVVGTLLMAIWVLGLPKLDIPLQSPQVISASPTSSESSITDRGRSDPATGFVRVVSGPIPVERPTTDYATPATIHPEAAQPIEPSHPMLTWRTTLSGIWGFGAVLLAIRLAMALAAATRLLRSSQAAEDAIVAEVAQIAAALGCRRAVKVQTSATHAVPFQYGILRPVLVLPGRMCRPAYHGHLPAIIAHELVHVRSGDYGWNMMMQAFSAILWFHPLAWRIGSAHRAACDAVCDAVSATYVGDVHAYCRTLAEVALDGAALFPTLGLSMARTCDVRRRIGLLQQKVFAVALGRRQIGGAALFAFVSVVLLACVRFAPAELRSTVKNATASAIAAQAASKDSLAPLAKSGSPSVDLYGDPLPPGAIARLSTVRYRALQVGHPQGLAFPDNQRVVRFTWEFAGDKSSFCWWNITNGKVVRAVPLADDPEKQTASYGLVAAVTPDGNIAAAQVGGQYLPPAGGKLVRKHWLKWWEVDTGRELASIPCDDPRYFSYPFALAPDGSTVVTGGPGAVRAWDRATRKQTATFDTKDSIHDLTISPSEKVAALIASDDGVVLWDFGAGQAPRTVLAKSAVFRPAKLRFSPDGKMLAVAGYPHDVRFLDARNGQLLRTLSTTDWTESAVTMDSMMAFSSDGKQLALAGTRETGTRVIVWDLSSDKPRHTLESPSHFVAYNGAFSPDGRLLAIAGPDLDIWDLNTEKRLSAPFVGNGFGIEAIANVSQIGAVATATEAYTEPIRLWEARTGRLKTMIRGWHSAGNVGNSALAVSPDGRLLACFAVIAEAHKSVVRIWDSATGKEVRDLAGRTRIAEVPCLSFSADGKRIAAASVDGKACVWNVDNGNLLSESVLQLEPTIPPPDHAGESSSNMYNGMLLQRVFFPGFDCIVVNGSLNASHMIERDNFHVFSVQTGKKLRTFGDDKLTKYAMALSPDGKRLLCEEYRFSHDKLDKQELRLWDVASGNVIWRKDLPRHRLVSARSLLAISTDGKRFAASIPGDPSQVLLGEMATGNVLRSFQCDSRPMFVSFSADGSLLAAGMSDGTALTWDISQRHES